MPRIKTHVNFGGVLVPQGEDGRFLDWRAARGKDAPVLTSPWGPLHFCIGEPGRYVSIDWAELPDGRFVVDVADEHDLLKAVHLYYLLGRDEVLLEVWKLVEKVVDDLSFWAITHETEAFVCDPYYVFRCLARELGRPGYMDMEDHQLRGEDPLRFEDLKGYEDMAEKDPSEYLR